MSDIRASDDERDRAVEVLRRHAAAGRLDDGELEERIGLALGARTRAELARLTEDLPVAPPRPQPAPVRRSRGCKYDPPQVAAIAVLLVAIWALTGAGYFWPMWPLAWFAFAMVLRRAGGNTRVIR